MTAGARCCRRAGSRSGSWPGVPLAYALSLKQRRRARPRTTRQEPCASQMTPALRHRRPRGPSRRAWRPLTSPFRARSLRRFIATLAPGLAPGISPRTATDLLWAFSNEELYRELVVERGWSPGSIRAVARPHPSRTALGRTHRHEPIGTPLIRCSHRIDGDIIDVHRPSVFCRVTESYERSPPSDRPRLASTMKPKPNVDRGPMRRRSSPASATIAVRPITTSPSGRSDTRRSTNTERMPGSAECPEAHRLRPD